MSDIRWSVGKEGPPGNPMRTHAEAFEVTTMLGIIGVLVLGTIYGQSSGVFLYDRNAVLEGEIHRLLTFHFIHTSRNHFLINALTLALLWAMYGRVVRMVEWATAMLICASAIGASLLLFNPEVEWSAGLSGLLYSLFAYGAVRSILTQHRASWLVIGFLVCKVAMEQSVGANTAMESFVGSSILVDAHLYGVASGLSLGLLCGALMWMMWTKHNMADR